MFDKKVIIVTPWFGEFAGGAEVLARTMAVELNSRGVETTVFTTCCKSPYSSWWEDYYPEGVDSAYGINVHRFLTNKTKTRYETITRKLEHQQKLTEDEKIDFFEAGINSDSLVKKIKEYLTGEYEIIALPYFHGLTHTVVNTYPGKVSIIPCFHQEPQFYWENTGKLLSNAKNIFFLSEEEKDMAVKNYGRTVGRRLIESPVTGAGVELLDVSNEKIRADFLPKNYFVYSGRKEKGKNVHLLCEWFSYYLEEFNRDSKLVFIGGGDKTLIPDNSNFIDYGFVSEAEKQLIIKNSKGILNLSENESFSYVIMEAWLLGVPVIVSSKCAVTRGHAIKSNGGLYVENMDEFALSLNFLEENSNLSKKLGSNGCLYVKKYFNFDNVLVKYLVQWGEAA